jgi:transcriptional regulator with XRE-family HTH domain
MLRNNLKRLRQQKRMNQRQLAEAVHTPQSLISDVERGQKTTWPKLTETLCVVLEKEPREIFPYSGNKNETRDASLAAGSLVMPETTNGGDPIHGD